MVGQLLHICYFATNCTVYLYEMHIYRRQGNENPHSNRNAEIATPKVEWKADEESKMERDLRENGMEKSKS